MCADAPGAPRSPAVVGCIDRSFALPAAFVSAYRTRKPPFGFNGLGEFVYRRTYARTKADGATEQWHETVERVVNGTFRMQQRWAVSTGQPWDARAAEGTARRMYDKIFAMKFLPPGRGAPVCHARAGALIPKPRGGRALSPRADRGLRHMRRPRRFGVQACGRWAAR